MAWTDGSISSHGSSDDVSYMSDAVSSKYRSSCFYLTPTLVDICLNPADLISASCWVTRTVRERKTVLEWACRKDLGLVNQFCSQKGSHRLLRSEIKIKSGILTCFGCCLRARWTRFWTMATRLMASRSGQRCCITWSKRSVLPLTS